MKTGVKTGLNPFFRHRPSDAAAMDECDVTVGRTDTVTQDGRAAYLYIFADLGVAVRHEQQALGDV